MKGLTAKTTTGKPSSVVIFLTESVTRKGKVGIPALAALKKQNWGSAGVYDVFA